MGVEKKRQDYLYRYLFNVIAKQERRNKYNLDIRNNSLQN